MNLRNFFKAALVIFVFAFAHLVFAQIEKNSDSSIKTNVRNHIEAEKSLSDTKINVTATDGVVTLTGNVTTDTQADKAVEIAQSISGVKDVDTSNLTVEGSKHPLDDSILTAKVKGMFIQEKLFGDKDIAAITIKVETVDGVVSLSGTADNKQQADNAIKLAKSVKGVKDVKSTIEISTNS